MKRILAILVLSFLMLGLSACNPPLASTTPLPEPTTWQQQYDLGLRYLSEGNYQEAIFAFTTAINIDAKQTEVYLGRGDAYYEMGELGLAIEDYIEYINLMPTIPEGYLRLGSAYAESGALASAYQVLANGIIETSDVQITAALEILTQQIKASFQQELFNISAMMAMNMAGTKTAYMYDFDKDGSEDWIADIDSVNGAYMFVGTDSDGIDVIYDESVAGGCYLEYSRGWDELIINKFYGSAGHGGAWYSVYDGQPQDDIASTTYTWLGGKEFTYTSSIKTQTVTDDEWNTFVTDMDCISLDKSPLVKMKHTERNISLSPILMAFLAEELMGWDSTKWWTNADINNDDIEDYLFYLDVSNTATGQWGPLGMEVAYYNAGSASKIKHYSPFLNDWTPTYITLISGDGEINVVIGEFDQRFS
jgi:Tfp pilus assembly protein PilF